VSRRLLALVIAASSVPLLATAQDLPSSPTPATVEKPSCALNASPDCRYFGITDIGLAYGPRRKAQSVFESTEPRGEMFFDGGVMRNVGRRNAIGATWFVSIDNDAVSTGPGVRYSRWLTKRQSLEAGAGIGLASSDYDAGSAFGVIRYRPDPFIGFSVRPEHIRRTSFDCVAGRCGFRRDNELRVLAGADLGGRPGATVATGVGIMMGVMIVVLAISFSGH